MRNIAFLKNYLFPKCSFSEKVGTMQKHLPWKSSSFLDIFILNWEKQLFRKVTVILKKWLLCRIFVLKKKLFWKNNCSEKVAVLKKEKKAAALKKYLLRKCNCCVEVVTLKKCEKVASPKIKLSWKSCNTCKKGNRYLKKKKKWNKIKTN